MEWLRSCYSSSWKLFQNSDVQTPGYYYFSPPGTPFFPGPVNVWSRNWVSDELPPGRYLGEQTGRQTYRKGDLPIPPPPAVVLGDPACVASGDLYPLPTINRTLPAGIDSRCYPGVAPDPSPALWLRPKGVPPSNSGDPVFDWVDSSIYGRDATNFTGPNFPVFDTTSFSIPTVDYSLANTHTVPSFPLAGDFAIFVVGFLGVTGSGPDPIVPVCASAVTNVNAPMRIGSTGLGTFTSLGVKRFPITSGEGVVRLYVVRRSAGLLSLSLNGTLVGSFTDPVPLTFNVVVPVFWSSGPTGQRFFGLVELQVYDQPLSDVGFASVVSGLIGAYGPLF